MRIIFECNWMINIWEEYEYMRIALLYNNILIIWKIIENSFYKNNKENSIILNLQSMWELICSSQDILKIMKWLSIDAMRNISLWKMLIIW